MLSDRDLQRLLNYQANHSILSVYLNTDPIEGNADFYKLRLRSLLKETDLSEDVEAILRFIDHKHDWVGRSVAIFSCVPENFFESFSLAVPLRDRVRISNRPSVKPLADVLDSFGGYGVVLVDKQGGRIFIFHLGELQEQEGVVGESVRRLKRGGGSQVAGRRGGEKQIGNIDEVTERNMRDVVEVAAHFFAENHVRRVLIGGTDDNVALFRNLLPKSYQSLVIGTFPISMTASHNEVLEKAMEIGREAEYHREALMANAIVTGAAKGRGAVVDLEKTISAVREGRVQILLFKDGYQAPGDRCKECGYISFQPIEICPFCGGEPERIPDVVEIAVRQVMQSGGEVEVLQKDMSIPGFDKIGALLRY